MSLTHHELNALISEKFGARLILTDKAAECLQALQETLPAVSWELQLLDIIVSRHRAAAAAFSTALPELANFRYRDILPQFTGRNRFQEYDWVPDAKAPSLQEFQEGPYLPNTIVWRCRLPQPSSLDQIFERWAHGMPTGGVNVIYVNGRADAPALNSSVPESSEASQEEVVGVDDLIYLLFRELYAGARITDLGILLLLRRCERESELTLARQNRWYLDSFEGLALDTGDPPRESA